MGKFFRWITQRRENHVFVETVPTQMETKKMTAGDVLKVLTVIASAAWATAVVVSEQKVHGKTLSDHETRLRAVERMEPQVQAMYAVIVEGKPRGVNPHPR